MEDKELESTIKEIREVSRQNEERKQQERNERELEILNNELYLLGIELSEETKLNIIKCAKDMSSVSRMGLEEAQETIIKAIRSYQ